MNILKRIIKFLICYKTQDEKIFDLICKSNIYYKKNQIFLSEFYRNKIYKNYNCIISPKAQIDFIVNFPHPVGIVIGEGVKIGENVIIYQNVTLGRKDRNIGCYPIVDDSAIIYAGAKILGCVRIGKNSIVGANAVVLNDVPDNCIAVGVPARIISKKDSNNE